MELTPRKINLFTLFSLPSAFACGVRLKSINANTCTTSVRLNWFNKNPFKSLFWAIQGMAAELASGALVMKYIKESGENISMLVVNNNAQFSKKATGKIIFTCNDGQLINKAISDAIKTGEGQTCWMSSRGLNKDGVEVSHFNFEWTVKVKS